MIYNNRVHLLAAVFAAVFAAFLLGSALLRTSASAAPNAALVAEGNDFATLVLRDPWDMSEFTDISQYLNQSGQAAYLQNIQVQNGIFSARSTSLADPNFFVLFPGYRTGIPGTNQTTSAIDVGKLGSRYPIPASTFHCLSIAMNVQGAGDALVYWFADDRLNGAGGVWGVTSSIPVSPFLWKLYTLDLASYPSQAGTPWTGSPTGQWQGLRIDPIPLPNVNFAVDWVRLTDCNPVNTTISWSGASVSSIWLTSASTGNSILVKTGLSGSSTSLDTQGVAAGTYQICLSSSSSFCNSVSTPNPSSLTVNQAPIATFNRPSFTSGIDYATQAGNPWDFNDPADIAQSFNVSWSLSNGLLNLTTVSGNPADPILYLNTPQVIASGSQFRYLTFRLNTQAPIQNVPNGMIVRWIWTIPPNCQLVSWDIPFDVGWQTYTVDLSNPFNGSPEQSGGSCPASLPSWSASGPITRLRFDPNENMLGSNLFQQLDWIRLTQVDTVNHGTPFLIQISLNKPPQGFSTTFYYTTDPQQPTQHLAAAVQAPPPAGSQKLYLPMIFNNPRGSDLPPVVNGVGFSWDTASVSPGTYYICVVADDGSNQTTYCSEAPVVVN